jgi:hypothetical protein
MNGVVIDTQGITFSELKTATGILRIIEAGSIEVRALDTTDYTTVGDGIEKMRAVAIDALFADFSKALQKKVIDCLNDEPKSLQLKSKT